jgi:hypothetical protein
MTAFAWSAIATVFVFATSQIIQIFVNFQRRNEQRRALCKSLKSEIGIIVSLISDRDSPDAFAAFVEAKSVEQLNAYSFVALQSSVYRHIAKDLWHLDSETVALVTRFYCLFDIFNGFIAHFKSREFLDAEDEIKEEMKRFFIQNVTDIYGVGSELQERLEL